MEYKNLQKDNDLHEIEAKEVDRERNIVRIHYLYCQPTVYV